MLRYVDPAMLPGITRKRRGRYWQYFAADGSRITDREEIDRLNSIGLPPAYERCWLCPDCNGHIQAIGFDARGRKQYRYHPDFRAERETRKYERMAAFGRALPRLRKRVEQDLRRRDLSCNTVAAAVVRLIDETNMRVGNEEYAKDNKSFGATTLRNRHAEVAGARLKLTYTGKHGIKRTVTVSDRRLAAIARRTQDLPGQHLFSFVDDAGEVRPLTSSDVNDYLREAMGDEFTAKDFRTWGASVLAFEEIERRADSARRIDLKSVIEPVAEALGNTPAIARKSYVHPALIEALKDSGAIGERSLPRPTKYLSAHERGLIEFLEALDKPKRKARKATAGAKPKADSARAAASPA
jgi:DNA topoisomerase I